eukprot:TRINITY_DN8390_c0_g1_i1.p1 TRINITY_DN8390_c0_g1~~TRINITY_DN8390_c0_g1_i1.p1  ORF type:complete len:401 (+),score=59.43 TRINITY_DN8390_c0_g1_i1:115-1203(+)
MTTRIKNVADTLQRGNFNISFASYDKKMNEALGELTKCVNNLENFYSFAQLRAETLNHARGIFGILPAELILEVFAWVNGKDLCRLEQVCKLFATMIADEKLWEHAVKKEYPDTVKPLNRNWRWLYQCRKHIWNADERKEGTGTWTFETGNMYYGEWKDDKRHGVGIGIMADGRMYMGSWENGKRSGSGRFTWPAGARNGGDCYEGEWKDSRRHGKGIYTWAGGAVYDGMWRNGSRHGKAVFKHQTGVLYEGEYVVGNMQGTGVMKWPDGSIYWGEFKNDERDGHGKYECATFCYRGSWMNNVRFGKGWMDLATGDSFQGNWADDIISGKGMYKSKSSALLIKKDDWTATDLPQFDLKCNKL